MTQGRRSDEPDEPVQGRIQGEDRILGEDRIPEGLFLAEDQKVDPHRRGEDQAGGETEVTKVLHDDQVEVAILVVHVIEGAEAREAAILLTEVAEVQGDVMTTDFKGEVLEDVTLKEADSEVVEVQEVGTVSVVVIEVDSEVEERVKVATLEGEVPEGEISEEDLQEVEMPIEVVEAEDSEVVEAREVETVTEAVAEEDEEEEAVLEDDRV